MTTDRQAWLEQRRTGVGGSDSAAALGLSKWKTQYQLYLEKIGEATTIETDAMKWGKLHEQNIRQEYANQTGLSVTQPGFMVHPDFEFVVGNVDGLISTDRVLEVKTSRSSDGWGEPGTDQVPEEYWFQVQHYLLLTGRDSCDVAVLIGGNDYRVYHIEKDAEAHEMMINGYREFWQMVVNRTPPQATTLADVKSRYPKSTSNAMVVSEDVEVGLRILAKRKDYVAEMNEANESLQAEICAFMKDSDTIVDSDGNALATWKQSKSTQKFDIERFEKEQPKLFKQYQKTVEGSRRFLIKELPPEKKEMKHVNRTSNTKLIGAIDAK